jgi:N-hydroxyarylamine O-acetyltransferase
MTVAIDIDAYFARIGYTGPHAATLETLAALHARHAEAIPFENLNPLLGWPVLLDLASLQQKLVREGRGGYCYEHNLLFSHALRALGFEVTWLAARVLWNAPPGTTPSRSHMLLSVKVRGKPYIADVGFGGLTLTAPLRLEPDIQQATPHEPFRLVRAGEEFVMQAKTTEEWLTLYRFSLQEQLLPDYEVSSWYLCHYPQSIFVTGLICARPAPDRRFALRNNELAVHVLRGKTERCILTTAADLREALKTLFKIALPEAPEVSAALERLAAKVPQAATA